MKVMVTTEYRFTLGPDGGVYTTMSFPYSFWTRYLEVFDSVSIIARASHATTPESGLKRVDGPQVNLIPLPSYIGPLGYLQTRRHLVAALDDALRGNDALLVRLPSQIASLLLHRMAGRDRPFGAEIVGDPQEAFGPGGVRHPLRRFFRVWFSAAMRQQCARACAVGYVTEHALQKRYPTSASALSTHYSSVELRTDAFVKPSARVHRDAPPFHVVSVGSLAQMYKGPDLLIDMTRILVEHGLDVRVRFVGGGKHLEEMVERSRAMGLQEHIFFCGQLPAGNAVVEELDNADVFVLASRAEGLPRALIEAMARGLPAVGTNVGGTSELLPAECLVPPNDAVALAKHVERLLRDPRMRTRMGERNLHTAGRYEESILRSRRVALYRRVLQETVRWRDGATRPAPLF